MGNHDLYSDNTRNELTVMTRCAFAMKKSIANYRSRLRKCAPA
jgi:hypothetical protein